MVQQITPAIYFLQGRVSTDLGITTGDIIRGVFPFVSIIIFTLILGGAFP